MRQRSKGGVSEVIATATVNWKGAPPYSATYTGGLLKRGSIRTMYDEVVPQFQKRSAKGEIFMNPCRSITETYSVSPGTAVIIPVGDSQPWTSVTREGVCLPNTSIPFLSVDADDIGRAIKQAGTQVSARLRTPNVEGLVDLAEAKKTIKGLRGTVLRLTALIKKLMQSPDFVKFCRRHGQTRNFSSFSLFMSSNWLEYRYQFIPLFLSVKGLLESIKRKNSHKRETLRAHVAFSDSDILQFVTGDDLNNQVIGHVSASRKSEVVVRTGILAEMVEASLLELNGVAASRIPSAVWELISFSFVVDWFANIGDMVSIMSPPVGYRELGSWTSVTVTQTVDWSISLEEYPDAGGWNYTGGTSNGSFSRTEFSRSSGVTTGITLKVFQGKLSDWIHFADAIALLRQLIR